MVSYERNGKLIEVSPNLVTSKADLLYRKKFLDYNLIIHKKSRDSSIQTLEI